MTDRLLPPIRAEELVPGRLAAQGQRVRRGELKALQTPRTYKYQSLGNLGTVTTNTLDCGSIVIYAQYGESIGIMTALTLYPQGSGTAARVWPEMPGWAPESVFWQTAALPVYSSYTYYSTTQGSMLPGGGASNTAPAYSFFLDRVAGNVVPGTNTIPIKIRRTAGTSGILVYDLNVWAMVL